MLACTLLFLADNLLHLPGCSALYLNHSRPQWWQFVSHLFCHGNFAHLSGNLFNLCVFGSMVERTEGALGVVAAFLVCGVGAALAAILVMPSNVVSVGASGAIFGLFAVSVMARLRPNLKSLLEATVLGQFVVR
ncbi:putative rhomboid protease ydcA, partial [Tetrabaena socialis]